MVWQRDEVTQLSMGQPSEFYFNFGWIGVIIGMPLVGGFVRFLNEYLRSRAEDAGVLAVYAVLAMPLTLANDGILAQGYIGAVKQLIVFSLVLALVNRTQRQPFETPLERPSVSLAR